MMILRTMLILAMCNPLCTAADSQGCDRSKRIGVIENLSEPGRFALSGNYAYMINNSSRELLTIDISDPAQMEIVHTLEIEYHPGYHHIVVHENAAYLTTGFGFFHVVDLTQPAEPQFAQQIDFGNTYIYCPVIIDNLMYIGEHSILDVTNPLHPTLIGSMNLPNPIAGQQHDLTYTTHLEYVDLSDPLNPTLPNPLPDFTGQNYLRFEIDIDTNTLYAFGFQSIQIYDITNPQLPIELLNEQVQPDHFDQSFAIRRDDIIIAAGSAYTDPSNTYIYDIGNQTKLNKVPLSTRVLPDYFDTAKYLQHRNGIDFIVSNYSFGAYEISTTPYVASVNTQGETADIHLHNDLAITANTDFGVELFDASDPTKLNRLSTFDSIESAFSIDMSGDTLYIAADRDDLVLVDISDPSNPLQISTIETGRRARDVRAIGNTLFVIDRIDGLWIFDITDPTNPLLRANLDLPGWNDQISFNDDMTLACIASANFGAFIVDISDLDAPVHLSTIEPLLVGDFSNGIMTSTFVGNTLYTPEFTEGFRIWDISNPANPIETDHVYFTYPDEDDELHPIAYQLTLHEDELIIANGNNGLAVFNNSDPTAPVFKKFFKGESTRRVELNANLAYSASTNGGLKVFDLADCSPCVADFNIDGELNFFDVSEFLVAYLDEDPRADLNSDNVLNFYDVSFFLTSYSSGCP